MQKKELYGMDLSHAQWKKSSRSQIGVNHCVEVADLGNGAVAMRDSKNPERELRFTPEEWAAFRDGVRDGEFG